MAKLSFPPTDQFIHGISLHPFFLLRIIIPTPIDFGIVTLGMFLTHAVLKIFALLLLNRHFIYTCICWTVF